jgi:hypothetical protein
MSCQSHTLHYECYFHANPVILIYCYSDILEVFGSRSIQSAVVIYFSSVTVGHCH